MDKTKHWFVLVMREYIVKGEFQEPKPESKIIHCTFRQLANQIDLEFDGYPFDLLEVRAIDKGQKE